MLFAWIARVSTQFVHRTRYVGSSAICKMHKAPYHPSIVNIELTTVLAQVNIELNWRFSGHAFKSVKSLEYFLNIVRL